MSTIRISINSINVNNQSYQVRDHRALTHGMKIHEQRSSEEHIKTIVRELRNNPKLKIKPIEVTTDPDDDSSYIIVDGFHRYAAFMKINKETKGKRFKQIRCKFTKDVPLKRALSINTEHKSKGLNEGQKTELRWQRFLHLMTTNPDVSIAQTAETIGISTATVSNWRKERKTYIEEGFFKGKSAVAKNAITGIPILKHARDELNRRVLEDSEAETDGQLCEADKEILQTILKAVNKAKEPEKLKRMTDLFWGENHNHVDYDLAPDIDADDYEF